MILILSINVSSSNYASNELPIKKSKASDFETKDQETMDEEPC